jgi:sugar/nucleoside kinase (ribokinase family)
MAHVLVIGSPSIDTLHFNEQTEISAGGAGTYTAMAAHRSGADVSMFGPRPDPVPDQLQPIADRLSAWLGPVIPLKDIPHFEISHDGDKATYLDFFVGEKERLDPAALPPDLSIYDGIHITALGGGRQQLRFFKACRERGAKYISAGTFIHDVKKTPDALRDLLDLSDVFFMNEEEAAGIFGSIEKIKTRPGAVLYITLGKRGAIVVQGDFRTKLPASPAKILNPTGAGDTFCGAAFSNLLQGMHPIMAAGKAMALAAQEIEHFGPSALLWDKAPPSAAFDERVNFNGYQIRKVSEFLRDLPEAESFNFVGDYLPPVDHPAALDYFFVSTLQQFSFWEAVDGRYHHPLIATIDGRKLKGSTYLYYAYTRLLKEDPEYYTPERQANLTRQDMLELFRADDGSDPMPALDLHLSQARQYGRDMLAMGITPRDVIERSKNSPTPLKTFLTILDHIGGYKEDPLRKKTNLLALCLDQRPEMFLPLTGDERIQPVIDYHAMRCCLRTGLIDVSGKGLREKLTNRQLLSPEEEWAVRYASYRAVEELVGVSGLSTGAVDWFTFDYTRSHCPEMTDPVCRECAVDPVCAHRKELFQPVIRTTFY